LALLGDRVVVFVIFFLAFLFCSCVMDALSSMWENFTLSEQEDAEVQIGEDRVEPHLLQGSILSRWKTLS